MLKYTSGVLLLSFGLKVNSVASVIFVCVCVSKLLPSYNTTGLLYCLNHNQSFKHKLALYDSSHLRPTVQIIIIIINLLSVTRTLFTLQMYWVYGAGNQYFQTNRHMMGNEVKITSGAFTIQGTFSWYLIYFYLNQHGMAICQTFAVENLIIISSKYYFSFIKILTHGYVFKSYYFSGNYSRHEHLI